MAAVPLSIATRRATLDDLDVVLDDLQAGFDSYVAFAPAGWRPPNVRDEGDRAAELLGDPGTWAVLALVDERPVGHVAFMPARERSAGEPHGNWLTRKPIPGIAHLWQLFVLPRWWGRGVAPQLHDAAIAEMRAQGYEGARLYTPSLHARARRFYERRAWRPVGEEVVEDLGLTCTEYRLVLGPPG
jgi:GNAT superfamily N-acetyltransferase